jgi:hypothetical protein
MQKYRHSLLRLDSVDRFVRAEAEGVLLS